MSRDTITERVPLLKRLGNFFRGDKQQLKVTAVVDESPGWQLLGGAGKHDYDLGTIQEIYSDALTAWRKNPIAWRIVAITTDYVVGDTLRISSPSRSLEKFIQRFWHHPQNRMDLRLESISDELSRAGDLFIVLFLNRQDGMSYLRLVTKDLITRIETAENDWEKELVYHEKTDHGESKVWLSPEHPDAAGVDGVMLHYAINRPAGALLGEGDLTTMLPWLQRYSRMLEDRVRLHWAIRSFLWIVTVPANMVAAKKEQYRLPPDTGSIVVKDSAESWEAVTPEMRGTDARYDLQAVRGMIDAGSGYPPHWRGEAGDANLATATAMQGPTERHLLRRQNYFAFILEDILYQAYQRAVGLGLARKLPTEDYDKLFTVVTPEISRWDNESLARAARELATAFQLAGGQLDGKRKRFTRFMLTTLTRFMGLPQPEEEIDAMLEEAQANG